MYRNTRSDRPGRDDGFLIVELMLVVAIVAILSLLVVPTYIQHVKNSKMSEGIAGVGMIRNALRAYAAAHEGRYPTLNGVDGTQLGTLNIVAADLTGKYFRPTDYLVSSTPETYTIRATLSEDASFWYEVDSEGNETRGGF